MVSEKVVRTQDSKISLVSKLVSVGVIPEMSYLNLCHVFYVGHDECSVRVVTSCIVLS